MVFFGAAEAEQSVSARFSYVLVVGVFCVSVGSLYEYCSILKVVVVASLNIQII